MNNTSNLRSYDGVESIQLNSFNENELKEYFNDKMQSATSNLNFIKENVYKDKPLNVCEIGSGNSKLLYSLENTGILRGGVGYEVSESRHLLAERFKKIAQSKKVTNICGDFLSEKIENKFDLIIGIDIVMQIIAPLYDEAEKDFLDKISDSLVDGGYLFLELEDYSQVYDDIRRMGGVIQKWEEFDESDPFQYSLHKITIDSDDNLVYDKLFIPRNEGEKSHFKNVIRNYTRGEIKGILEQRGFEVTIFSMENDNLQDIQRGSYLHDYYRVLARRN